MISFFLIVNCCTF